MKRLDLRRDDLVIVYDDCGMWSAPRVWWMLVSFGAKRVAVLNGGLKKWLREGLMTVQGEVDEE